MTETPAAHIAIEGPRGPEWDPGYLALARAMRGSSPDHPLTIRPVRDPRGDAAPDLLEVAQAGSLWRYVVDANGIVGNAQGRAGAEAFFGRVGFPTRRRLSWYLVCEVLHYFRELTDRWFNANLRSWQAADALYVDGPAPEVRYAGDGTAVLVMTQRVNPFPGEDERGGAPFSVRARLEVQFDPTGHYQMRQLREVVGLPDQWEEAPVEP